MRIMIGMQIEGVLDLSALMLITFYIEILNGRFQNGASKLKFLWYVVFGIYKMKFLIYSRETISRGVFGVADYESKVRFGKFKMADPRWQTKQTK